MTKFTTNKKKRGGFEWVGEAPFFLFSQLPFLHYRMQMWWLELQQPLRSWVAYSDRSHMTRVIRQEETGPEDMQTLLHQTGLPSAQLDLWKQIFFIGSSITWGFLLSAGNIFWPATIGDTSAAKQAVFIIHRCKGNPQGTTVRPRRQDLIGFGLCASQKANTTKNVVEWIKCKKKIWDMT